MKFLVKTMTPSERNTLLTILPHYLNHLRDLKERNQISLIAPILGTFHVKLQGIRAINVLVMRNSIQK